MKEDSIDFGVLAAKAELRKLNISNGDVLVISSDDHDLYSERFIKYFKSALAKIGLDEIMLILKDKHTSIESLDEYKMAGFGWYKKR
jgi:ABC-type sugar transport system substrate-binding protein